MRWLRLVISICVVLAAAVAQEAPRLATREAPPYTVSDASAPDGWSGLAFELWREVAARVDGLDGTPVVVTRSLPGMFDALVEREADVAVGALTITPEREARIDFTHQFLASGIGIAARASGDAGFGAVLARVFSWDLLQAVGALTFVLLAAGAAVWLFERRRNAEQFGGGMRGLGEGFWWSAVTMTTVGYGDRAPVTLGGRVVALVWMFASIIVISSYTASIASALTVSRLQGAVQGPEDLPRVRVASVAGSAPADWLTGQGLGFRTFADTSAAIDALAAGEVDAVVYDIPILKYLARTRHPGEIAVLPDVLRAENYAFALPQGSPRLEAVNRALAGVLQGDRWAELRRRWLGE